MTSVMLIALPDALPSCLASWEDLFSYANRLAGRRRGTEVFSVARWAPGELPPADRPDVVLLPARVLEGPEGTKVPPSPPGLVTRLGRWADQGTVLGAVCAGVFCLAEGGFLDHHRATTHWSLVGEFRRRFPRVNLEPEALVLETETRILGGGMTAYFDVGLRVIRRWAGVEVARDCASVFLLDPERRHQSPFVPVGYAIGEADPLLARAIAWALDQPTLEFTVAEWASAVAVEKRTLERRAQAVWAMGPAERLRQLRLDRARLLLTGERLTWEEVGHRCGYRDAAAFRRLFFRRFGQSPGEYRRRFGPG